MDFIKDLPAWVNAATLVVAACAAVAALTPTPKDDSVFAVARKVIDFLGLNFLNAKNK